MNLGDARDQPEEAELYAAGPLQASGKHGGAVEIVMRNFVTSTIELRRSCVRHGE
jgi:hypothetical protein